MSSTFSNRSASNIVSPFHTTIHLEYGSSPTTRVYSQQVSEPLLADGAEEWSENCQGLGLKNDEKTRMRKEQVKTLAAHH